MKKISYLLWPFLLLLGMGMQAPPKGQKFTRTLTLNGDQREFIVYKPVSYSPNKRHPLVFMLHGSSGNGEKYFNISGWNEIADKYGIIMVYPTSWHYDVKKNGCGNNHTTKWNNYKTVEEVCNPKLLRDDIQFFKAMMKEVKKQFQIDLSKIYVSGFSNGAGMSSRLAVELGDKIAAIAIQAGTLPTHQVYTPKRNVPIHYWLGTKDDRFVGATSFSNELPFDFTQLFSDKELGAIVETYCKSFELNPAFRVTKSTPKLTTATFVGKSGRPDHLMKFTLIKGLGHRFLNPPNRAGMAEQFWNFLKQYSLP